MALGACSYQPMSLPDEADIVGRYTLKSKMIPKSKVVETLVIYPDHTFYQERLSDDGVNTNTGSWIYSAGAGRLFLQHLLRWEEEDWRTGSSARTTFELDFSAPLSRPGGRTEITLNDDIGLRFVQQKQL